MADVRVQRHIIPAPLQVYDFENEAAFRREVEALIDAVDLALTQEVDAINIDHPPAYYALLDSGTYSGTILASAGSVTIPQTGQYYFEAVLRMFATSTQDWRVRARYSSTALGYYTDEGSSVALEGATTTVEGTSRTMVGTNGQRMVRLYGHMDITAAGGDFHLDLSEISGTTNLTLYAGSFLRLTRLGDT